MVEADVGEITLQGQVRASTEVRDAVTRNCFKEKDLNLPNDSL